MFVILKDKRYFTDLVCLRLCEVQRFHIICQWQYMLLTYKFLRVMIVAFRRGGYDVHAAIGKNSQPKAPLDG